MKKQAAPALAALTLCVLSGSACPPGASAGPMQAQPIRPIQPVQVKSQRDALAQNTQGLKFFNRNDYRNALPYFERAIKINPTLAPAHYHKALCLLRLENPSEALAELDLAIKYDAAQPNYYLEKCHALSDLQRPKEAMKALNQGVALGGKNPLEYMIFERGLLSSAIGDDTSAVKDFSAVIKIAPKHADAYYERAVVEHKRGAYNDAIKDLSEALKYLTRTDYGRVNNLRARCYEAIGRHDLAEKDLKSVQGGIIDEWGKP